MREKITEMTEADLPEVMELEREIFSWPWTEEFFLDELGRGFSHIFLARDADGALVGFVCFWALLDEAHILNLAVRENYRRRGIGKKLVLEALKYAKRRGAKGASLEVREKNTAAIAFYGSLGFERAGLRKRYYDSPPDNAVIMRLYDIARAGTKIP